MEPVPGSRGIKQASKILRSTHYAKVLLLTFGESRMLLKIISKQPRKFYPIVNADDVRGSYLNLYCPHSGMDF